MEPVSETIKAQGADLYTLLHPNPGKETVILLHGGPCVPDGLGPVAASLSPHFQVIDYHQRGTALSPCRDNRFRISSYLSDLNAVAHHYGLTRFHLFGHSWGGCYAQIYTDRFPQRVLSLFLCCPAAGPGRNWGATRLDVASYIYAGSTTSEWIGLCAGSLLGVFGSTRGFQLQFSLMGRIFNRGAAGDRVPFRVDLVRHRPVIPTVLAILRCPPLPPVLDPPYRVTIMYGDRDAITKSQRYVRERYPGSTQVTLPGSGHFPWLQNPKSFLEALAAHYSF